MSRPKRFRCVSATPREGAQTARLSEIDQPCSGASVQLKLRLLVEDIPAQLPLVFFLWFRRSAHWCNDRRTGSRCREASRELPPPTSKQRSRTRFHSSSSVAAAGQWPMSFCRWQDMMAHLNAALFASNIIEAGRATPR